MTKPHENPAIGLLLCASKGSELLAYALSRTLSPALVAQYETQLPDKGMLAAKLHEFHALHAAVADAVAQDAVDEPGALGVAKPKAKRQLQPQKPEPKPKPNQKARTPP